MLDHGVGANRHDFEGASCVVCAELCQFLLHMDDKGAVGADEHDREGVSGKISERYVLTTDGIQQSEIRRRRAKCQHRRGRFDHDL